MTAVKQASRDFTETYMYINNIKVTTDNIEKFEINYSIGSSDKLTIGNANTSKISVSVIVSQDTPAQFANSVIPYAVLLDSVERCEIPLGIFKIDKESVTKTDLLVTFDAYDIMYDYDYVIYNRTQCTTTRQLLSELVSYYDVKIHDISIFEDLPWNKTLEGLTVRQIIQELALLYGSNAMIDREGYLIFVKPISCGFQMDASNYIEFRKENDEITKVSKLSAVASIEMDEEVSNITYSKGDSTGSELEIQTDNINTQEQVDALYDRASFPISYQGYQLSSQGFPHLDCGDIFVLTTNRGEVLELPIVSHTLSFSGSFTSNFKAAAISNSVKGNKTSISANIANLKEQIDTSVNRFKSQIANTEKEIANMLDDMGILQEEVKTASDAAAKAQVSADGKNKVFYSSSAPTTENDLKVNDLWFNTGDGNCSYRWNGSQWEKKAYGNGAIDSLDAGKINTGELVADRIAANTILAKILSVGGLSADYINVNDLKAIVARIGGFDIDDSRIYSSKTMADGKVGYVFMSNDFYSSQNSIPYNPVFGVKYDNEWKWFVRSNGAMYGKDVDFRGQLATYSNTDSNTYSSVSAGNIYSQGLDNDNYKSIWIHNGAIDLNRVDASTYKNRNVVTSDLTQMYDSNGDLFVDMNSITGNIGFYKTVNIVASPSSDNALKLYNTSRKECSITYQNNTNRYTVGLGVGGNVGNFAIWDGGQILESLDANGNKTVLGDLRSYRVLSNANSGNTVGLASNRWNTGYFNTVYNSSGAITTSDRSSKKEFTAFDDRYYNLAEIIDLQLFKYIDGTSDRYHIGAVAQDVAVAMEQCEITLDECGIVCIEHWSDDDGNEQEMYNIRYDELNVLMNWYNRKRITEQQNEIEELKRIVSTLVKQQNN